MARYLNTEEDEWDKLIDDKLREIDKDEDDVPDSLPKTTDKQNIKYSIKKSKKETE